MFRHFGLGQDNKTGYELLRSDSCSHFTEWMQLVVKSYKERTGLEWHPKIVTDTTEPRPSRKVSGDGIDQASAGGPKMSSCKSVGSKYDPQNIGDSDPDIDNNNNLRLNQSSPDTLSDHGAQRNTPPEDDHRANDFENPVEHVEARQQASVAVLSNEKSSTNLPDVSSAISVNEVNEPSTPVGSLRQGHIQPPGAPNPSSNGDQIDATSFIPTSTLEIGNPVGMTNIPQETDSLVDSEQSTMFASSSIEAQSQANFNHGSDGVFDALNSPEWLNNAQLSTPAATSRRTSLNRRSSSVSTPLAFSPPSPNGLTSNSAALHSPTSDQTLLSVAQDVPDTDFLPHFLDMDDGNLEEIVEISLLELTDHLLWAGQKARATKIQDKRWKIHRLETRVEGMQCYVASLNGRVFRGLRLIKIPAENRHKWYCIFGCRSPGRPRSHEYIP